MLTLDIGQGEVKKIQFLNTNRQQVVVLTSDKYLVYDLLQKTVVKSFRSHKKDKKLSKNPESIVHQLPQYFSVSPDDKVSVEIHKEVILMRNLVSN